jgi:hypothetical protein
MPKIKTVRGTENRKIVSQKEWLAARLKLLAAEKDLTRRSGELVDFIRSTLKRREEAIDGRAVKKAVFIKLKAPCNLFLRGKRSEIGIDTSFRLARRGLQAGVPNLSRPHGSEAERQTFPPETCRRPA